MSSPGFEPSRELENFEQIASQLIPGSGDIPALQGIEVYGESLPLTGVLGGDHIIYVDFKRRYDLDTRIVAALAINQKELAGRLRDCKTKAGIAIMDVSGHQITDGILALMLHQAFLLGVRYELDFFGDITTRLFENINARFLESSSVSKFLTLIYGEISEEGRFRFISAGHPVPVVFSRSFDRIVDIASASLTTFPPIGTMPTRGDIDSSLTRPPLGFKERYEINEINLMGAGDILLLYTDGLSEHNDGQSDYFPGRFESVLRRVKDLSAQQIFDNIRDDLISFSPPSDDLSLVVIKRL